MAILVAEDNVLNQKLITEMLSRQGHRVTIAANGGEALARLAAESFDMVLMDIQMPDMDGFEVTAAIRRREAEGRSGNWDEGGEEGKPRHRMRPQRQSSIPQSRRITFPSSPSPRTR